MLSKKINSLSNLILKKTHLNQNIFYNITVRKFTPLHEWIDLDYEEKVGRIGITNLGLKIIGNIARADIKPVGTQLNADDAFAQVIGQHYIADLVTPVKTEILSYNKHWLTVASILTLDVEDENQWFVEINLADQAQFEKVEGLLSQEHYEKRFEQFHKLDIHHENIENYYKL
ncbi:glycine cleavage system H protein (macronuclear) [Tetrahymena thermophila SB210]|uniref:Glycine cleavage system H protein n=1 Tax=Tetrahymena thermophila (strain SB210) TaxID=312017 RepID=Q231P7_TETTS|nr:glycine cleavage system H protein [Tetrahymena thermophila SB210]EAR91255.2 glycine cleavage system H protein [Tetrahymena thermophila SB210]|eukprot:XP_001011500.2 glycine cleavage system H protein [Tetrahymena thermophila SB210]